MGIRLNLRPSKLYIIVLLGTLLVACAPVQAPSAVPVEASQIEVQLREAPPAVCSSATQVRLALQLSASVPDGTSIQWHLYDANNTDLGTGTGMLKDGPFLVTFPGGQSLPSGSYTIRLSDGVRELAAHTFSVNGTEPAVTSTGVSLVPEDAPAQHLAPPVQHFYIRYAYEGGCLGAPYWVTVFDPAGERICNQTGALETTEGAHAVPCYLAGGSSFSEGVYRVEITLMGDVKHTGEFEIGSQPSPPTAAAKATATATTPEITCGPLFAAAALTPEGKPFLTPRVFDWYTQAIYVGSQCENLSATTQWQSAWYHEGELVREASGQWQGAGEGVVWDNITGVEANPFLPPGVYTVTMEIGSVAPLTTTFSVYDYQPSDAEETAP